LDRRYQFDDVEIDVPGFRLFKAGKVVPVEPKALNLLVFLVENRGRLVRKRELIHAIWSDAFVSDHVLNRAIGQLRKLLADDPKEPRYIETVPTLGYRFIGDVEPTGQVPRTATAVSSSLIPRAPSEEQPASSLLSDQQSEVNTSPFGTPTPSVSATDVHRIRAIAVLPLEDFSGVSGHEYFADGMTEALITCLAKIKALRVISRTSAMQYRRVQKPLPQIARELNVDAVIEGSVLRSGDRVRISAQLIHATSDQHLWAESYERDFRDILSLQSEIARRIVDAVQVILTPEERAQLGSSRKVDPEAHELYLKGRYHWNKRTEENIKKAIGYFRRALDCDPIYAQGHAGLADAYHILGYYNLLPPKEAYPKGRAAALKALQLDNSLAEPHATLGVIKRDFEWDWKGAEVEFQRAIEINPGLAEAYHWHGTLLSMQGLHSEALREKTKALEIDPLSVVIRTDVGRLFYFARDYDQAIERYLAALDMDPNNDSAHLWFAHVYQQMGKFEEALSELQKGWHLSNESTYALARHSV
jgi:TolB-like protein/DNA-binding winged helix-turn-helix (wHTH) protein/Tfp pilus assembly protein PilF